MTYYLHAYSAADRIDCIVYKMADGGEQQKEELKRRLEVVSKSEVLAR